MKRRFRQGVVRPELVDTAAEPKELLSHRVSPESMQVFVLEFAP